MSRLRIVGRIAAISAAALIAAALAWIVGGNAIASRRERAATREWEATFGPYQALVRKYTVAESNASARRVEEIGRQLGFDLELREGQQARPRIDLSEEERDTLRAWVDGELTGAAGAPLPPPKRVAELLSSRRASLLTFEEFLSSAVPPSWAFDPSGSPEDWPWLPLGSHLQLQRLLVADALVSFSRGEDAHVAQALEASWALNQSLATRPVIVSQMMAMAVRRLQVGALRRTGGSTRIWAPRLEEMGSRRRLVEALLLDHGDVRESRARLRRLMAKEQSAWAASIAPIEEVRERLFSVAYARLWSREIVALRDATPFTEPAAERRPRTAEGIIVSIVIPNIRESFRRSDRLALDAELTGKILRVKEVRRAQGAWPQPAAEIASSRFPGLSWNYRVEGDAMTIALNRELPKPTAGLVLPTSFSSRAPAP